MELLYILLVLLLVTRIFGEIAERLGQPALTGELASGVVLGLVFGEFSGYFPVLANLADNWVFLIHYLGKTLLPVQLAFFPTLADTSLVPGLMVLLAVGTLVVLRRFGRPGQHAIY